MTDSSNQEEFKKVSKIQQRLDILIEHVESRKEALEEEIQEHLHESLANARDSIERIQENIAPKVEKAIHTKMEEIDRKMRRLNEDSLESDREELKNATPASLYFIFVFLHFEGERRTEIFCSCPNPCQSSFI